MKALLALALSVPAAAALAADRAWDFTVYLNNTPVGHHWFLVRDTAEGQEVTITARIDVKVLGVTVYRYEHEAREQWKGNCLVHLASRTNDDGKISQVDKEPGGCQMTFAYWNPLIVTRSSLINSQSGEDRPVTISSLGEDPVQAHGQMVPAQRYRITGPKHPIDLWYSAQGEWLSLQCVLGSGRTLVYRLEQDPPDRPAQPAPRDDR